MKKLFFLFLLIGHSSVANTLEVFSFSHPNQLEDVRVEIQEEECMFLPHTLTTRIGSREKTILEDIYFSVEILKERDQEVQFSFSQATNIEFQFKIKKNGNSCETVLVRNENQKVIRKVSLDYRNYLGVPTLKYFKIFYEDRSEESVSPDFVQDYFPFYEFHLGAAFHLHSNIRPYDENLWADHDPAYELIPSFLFRYGPVFVSKDGAGTLILPLPYFTVLATFLLEGEPYKPNGLSEREKSVYFGPLIKSGPVEMIYYKEILGKNSGSVVKLTLAPEFQFSDELMINPRLSYQFWDKKYTNYYFQVSSEESASSGLPSYQTGSTHNYAAMVRTVYQFPRLQVFSESGYKFYGEEVYHSPIVQRNKEFRFTLGFLYRIL